MKQKNLNVLLFFITLATGCAYFSKNINGVYKNIENGKNKEALELLQNEGKWTKGKSSLLFYLEKGTLLHKNGNYSESNRYFRLAENIIEKQNSSEYISANYSTSSKEQEYLCHIHEAVMMRYFTSINYLMLGNKNEALAECDKGIQTMKNFNNRNNKDINTTHFATDAFLHIIKGLCYDANSQFDSAFLSYKNAYNSYENEYKGLYLYEIPLQLKTDLLRTGYLSKNYEDVRNFEQEFQIRFQKSWIDDRNGFSVIFWFNGLASSKTKTDLTFKISHSGTNTTLENTGYGFLLLFNENKSAETGKVEEVKLTIPLFSQKYLPHTNASAQTANDVYKFSSVHKIHDMIAMQQKKLLYENLSITILDVIKKNGNQQKSITHHSKYTDTRIWFSLPGEICYARVTVPLGIQKVKFTATGNSTVVNNLTVKSEKGLTNFQTIFTESTKSETN